MPNDFKKELDLTAVFSASIEASKKQIHQFELAKRKIKEIGEQNVKIKKTFEDIRPAMDKILGKTPLGLISKINNNMLDFNKSIARLGGRASFAKSLNMFFKDLSGNVGLFSKNLGTVVRGGFTGMFKNFGIVIKSLMGGFKGLLASASGLLLPIGLIVAAIFTLKRMWTLNVGGMQTMFFKFVGTLKNTWGKFSIAFNKFLLKMSPLIKWLTETVGNLLIGAFEGLFVVLQSLFSFLTKILSPVIWLFEKLSGSATNWGKAMKVVGYIVGAVAGIILTAKTIMWGMSLAMKAVTLATWLFNAALWANPITWIVAGIIALIAAVVLLVKYWDKVTAAVKKAFSWMKKLAFWRKKEKEEERADKKVASTSVSKEEAMTRVITHQNRSTITNNLTVQASGAVTPESAPILADTFAQKIQQGEKT